MQSEDMKDSVAKVRRSLPSSNVHSYQWMYSAMEARLETMRLEEQEKERVAAYRPDSGNPITPGIETPKGRGKGKPTRDTSKEACQRMMKDGKCSFESKCWFSHDPAVVEAARKKGKTKIFCRFFQQGSCLKGDRCDFSHGLDQNGTGENSNAMGTVAISAVAHQIEPLSVSRSVQGSSGCVAQTAAPGTKQLTVSRLVQGSSGCVAQTAAPGTKQLSKEREAGLFKASSGFVAEAAQACLKTLSEEECAEYILAAQASESTGDSEVDDFLKEIQADFDLAKKLERDVQEYEENKRGCFAQTAPADEKGTLQLPAEVREWLDVPTKMRGKSKSKKKKKK